MNKKLILSLLSIVVVAVVAFGATTAFFSDTETSTGNVFTAGAIDLKVDSEGHYNGFMCVDGKWQSCKEVPGTTDLITNGGFEDPEVVHSAKWQIFASIPGWAIDWEPGQSTSQGGQNRPDPALQEYHEGVNGWSTPYGNQYAELDSDWFGPDVTFYNEPSLVNISQNVSTTVGKKYLLSWAFSPRPGTNAANNVLKIRINGVETQVSAAGEANVAWQTYTREFTADSSSTEIEFAGGGTADSLGVFLDNIQMVEYVRECTPSTEYTEACYSTWSLKDIDPTLDKFFSFGDIKPGDYGENTISLHITNNPAYACLNFLNMHNDDPSLTEPESNPAEGNDQSQGPDNGELAQNIQVLLWRDDGDNVYEEGEPLLHQGPEPASTVFASSYELANPVTGPYQPNEVKYVGLAWCAGEFGGVAEHALTCNGANMGNEAQADQLSVDVSLYVEQERHNGEFSCVRPSPSPTTSPEPTPTPEG